MPTALLPFVLATALGSAARLPADVVPKHYDLFFDVDPAKGTFSGTVDIDLEVRAPVQEVVLNVLDLELSELAVAQGEKTLHPTPQPRPADQQIALAAPLGMGLAHLHARFAAPLRKDLRGLYLAKTQSGEAWAATQFEATSARAAFPCFDEPSLRATFTVRARVPAGFSALSNTPVTAERVDGSAHVYDFAQTPRLPSYLVALAVGHFGVIEGHAEGLAGSIPIRVVAPAGQEQLGAFALRAAEQVLPWYEKYTGVPYPFAKLDMVAVPEFEAGGMENAGAIFYRMAGLLLDDAHSSIEQQERVERVVAHEIAHQWFGDLVTMRWWDDLWLNESFASVMEYFCVRELRPEWPRRQAFTADVAHAKATDSLRSTHAIHSPVADPAQADSQFDEITYVKGEGVLAMLANAVGDEVFRQGLHRYLTANAFGNARADDLFDAIGEAAQAPVTEVAESWIGQVGLPVVSVHRKGATLAVAQRRFTASASKDDGTRWRIPFCVDSATPPVPAGQNGGQKRAAECLTLLPSSATVDVGHLDVPSAKDWVFANADGAGVYRVAYDGPMLAALLPALRTGSLTPEERIALLADLRALAWSDGKLAPLLDAVRALSADRDAEVVGQITGLLVALDNVASGAQRGPLSAWARQQLQPLATELGWEPADGEPPERSLLRADVLDTLDWVGRDPVVAAEARRRVDAAASGGAVLTPSLRSTLLTIAARHGDAALWEGYRAQMQATTEPERRIDYLIALMAFQTPELTQKSLALTLTDAVATQDVGGALARMFAAPATRDAAWSFLKTHFEPLRPRITSYLLKRRLIPSLSDFCSLKDRDDIGAVFKASGIPGLERPLDRSLESIEICAKAKPRLGRELGAWLGKRH